jgi:Mn-containing catalase
LSLRSNIAAEAEPNSSMSGLSWGDAGTKDALQFLMNGEITDMKAFAAALEPAGHFVYCCTVAPNIGR